LFSAWVGLHLHCGLPSNCALLCSPCRRHSDLSGFRQFCQILVSARIYRRQARRIR
jgi:hypothetical protein